jgi:hypothetical protein
MQNLAVINTGTASVSLSQVTISGTGFTMISGSGATLATGQSVIMQIKFAPQATGAASGTLSVTSNASNTTMTVALSGVGTQGAMSANPSAVSFGNVVVGSNSGIPVTLTNSGTGPLSITGSSISGTGFTMSALANQTLNAGQTASFTATYSPTAAGSASGSVSIATDAPGSPLKINLTGSGTATAAQISLNPTTVAFHGVAVGGTATQNVTVTNTGNATLTISSATITGTGYTTSLSGPVTVNAGANATFAVTYKPMTEGAGTGNISITSNAGAAPATVALTGTGMQSLPAANPTSASFGSVSVGNSNSQPITLTNSGNSTLTFSQVGVTGTGFSITGISTATTIAAGASATFNVVFTPAAEGSANGTITLATNGSPSQLTIAASGTGAVATKTLSVSPATLTFGSVPAGQTASLPTTVTNTGNSNITISNVAVTGTGFSGSGIGSGVILTPGQSATLTVQFSPSTTGDDTGMASITSDATNSPSVTLSGSSHSVGLSWTASSSTVSGYNIYRATSSGAYGSAPLNPSPIATTAFSDPTVSGGQTYYYVVRSVESGVESANSSEIQTRVPTP